GLLERTPAALEALRAAGRVVVEEWDEPMVYLAHLHRAETGVAEAIRSLSAAAGRPLEASGGGAASPADGLRLSPAQEEAVRLAGRHRLLLLTGGPGTGKTTVVRAIVRSLEAAGETVRLAAPTGRAAQRLREAAG